jgi:hypothetical protein
MDIAVLAQNVLSDVKKSKGNMSSRRLFLVFF